MTHTKAHSPAVHFTYVYDVYYIFKVVKIPTVLTLHVCKCLVFLTSHSDSYGEFYTCFLIKNESVSILVISDRLGEVIL